MTLNNNEAVNSEITANNTSNEIETQSNIQTVSNTTNEVSPYFNFKLQTFEDIEKLANYVAKSPIFNIQYVETVDGVKRVNVASIVTSLMLGAELGFKPIEAITLGRFLNRDAILKVHLGKSLGLSPVQAIRSIYVWEGKNGRDEIYTSIHVINKVLTDAKIKREIIENGTPVKVYFHAVDNTEITDYQTNSQMYLDITGKSVTELKSIPVEEIKGKIPIVSKTIRRAIVKLTRGNEVIAIPYSEQQAIDAGLLAGTDRWGNTIKGKENWNNHTATMLIKMSIMLGARIIASDRLHGIYEADELPVKVSNLNNSNNIADVEVEIE
jgi:hypothetical protein